MTLAETLAKIKNIKSQSVASTNFTSVEVLSSWLNTQQPNAKNEIPCFDFTGYIVSTVFDTSPEKKWSRIQ